MKKNFKTKDWKKYLPQPICEAFPEYGEFYEKAWEMARDHVKSIDGMPQNPYMDEAFCDTQVWIWDTCFMSLFCKFAQEVFPGVETFKNFYAVLYEGKKLPEVIPTEQEPVWTGAKPGVPFNIKVHIADNPPLFAWAEYENALLHGDKEYLKELLYEKRSLQRHYEWFENRKEKEVLPEVSCKTELICDPYGYKWEGGRSGMDNTPRGRTGDSCECERPNNPDILWIDAICQQALAASCISESFALLGDEENASVWKEKYLAKKKIVNDLYWDSEDKFYYDIDCNDHRFYKIPTIASYWTMTAEIATKEQAKELTERLFDPEYFGGAKVPFISLAKKDGDYTPTGKYWRGSAWLPSAYATLKGLAKYGYFKEAHEAACGLLKHMYATYREYDPHTIWEAYAPEAHTPATQTDGVTIVRPDFCGWSALGPISVYLEYVLGFHTVNAFENVVEWEKPKDIRGKIGVKNLRFGSVVTDIEADETTCVVSSNKPYTLKICGKAYPIEVGETVLKF